MSKKLIKIKNFEEFLSESEDQFFSYVLRKFYLLVNTEIDPRDSSENPLAKHNSDTQKLLFERVYVTKDNWRTLSFKPNLPILNFTKENPIVEQMIQEGIIKEDSLYNHPIRKMIVSDKSVFHKNFYNCEFIPKTVFTVKDTKKLKFPIIAKPAQGNSAEGIQKFDSFDELSSSKLSFDVFSEMIDISREFRCFCFRNEILELDERVKIDDSEDFLVNASTKTNFYYKQIENYSKESSLKKIIEFFKNSLNLDYFSLDFAEDVNGDLYVIEINSSTGMGTIKLIKLYKRIYQDYFNIPVDDFILHKLGLLSDEYHNLYNKEKASDINECTVISGNVGGTSFLFKNRDRSFTPDTKIVVEKINNVEIVYYTDQTGWIEGMNEYGVGFVFSMLSKNQYTGYTSSWHVTDEPKNKSLFIKFQSKIKEVLTAKNVQSAIQKVIDSKKGGNFLISDSKESYEIEIFKGEVKKRKLNFDESSYYVKTNHGELISHAGHQSSGDSIKRASSSIRRHQAIQQLIGIQDISEIPSRMKFQAFDHNSSLNTFRTDSEEYTISQCLMDLTNLKFYFFHDYATADSIKIEDNSKEHKIKIDVRKI